MSDIEKINLIHNLKREFKDVDKNLIQHLYSQIEHDKHKENIDRFFRGYAVEDLFLQLFSIFPWVKQITRLDQNQKPERSKKDYQVPDYILLFENSKLQNNPLLIEVKSVPKKLKLNLMRKQVYSLLDYAKDMKQDLVFAIYWEKMYCWTINSIKNFEKKKNKFQITMPSAIQNDLSEILGDQHFLLLHDVYKKTIYADTNKPLYIHNKYGKAAECYISTDNEAWIPIDILEEAFLSSSLSMLEEKKEFIENNKLIVFEKNNDQFNSFKLSTLIIRHLATCSFDIKEEDKARISLIVILEVMKKIKLNNTYFFPAERNEHVDRILEIAFGGTKVLDSYLQMS